MQKSFFIRFGDFLFKHRNHLFPVVIVLLVLLRPPAHTTFSSNLLESIKDGLAIGVVVLGLAMRAFVIGFAYIKRGGLSKQVYADTLVTTGIFGLCRNPLYVGNLLVYVGVFMMHGDPLIMALGTAIFVVFYLAIVAAEEFFLHQKFGTEYDNYCNNVPRWLPHIKGIRTRFATATEGMDYNLKRVVLKDYSTAANAAISLMLIEYYEELVSHAPDMVGYTTTLVLSLLVVGAIALSIRTIKKRGTARA